MPVTLRNQNVLIIGASSGIGRATAVLFAREGARVMASARRSDRLEQLKGELEDEGLTIEVSVADASKAAEMERLAETTRERLGEIDIMVYATGTNIPDRSMQRLTVQIWDMMIAVNLDGAYYATRAVLPQMRERRAG